MQKNIINIKKRQTTLRRAMPVMMMAGSVMVASMVMPNDAMADPLCEAGNSDLGGSVWRDFNADGIKGINEPGFSNLTVTAYDNNGLVDTTTVLSDGTYHFDGIFDNRTGDNAHIRLEFSGLPDWLQGGVQGSSSGTTVQFHSAASCAANLAVHNPANYCQSNPDLVTSRHIVGDPLAAGSDGAALDSLVSFGYTASGTSAVNGIGVGSQTGSLWGIAHDPKTDRLYAAAAIKRHSGLGPSGLGAIYLSDPPTSSPALFTVLPDVGTIPDNATRGLPDTAADPSHDPDAFTSVASLGIGDIDLSEDGSKLYAVNLNQRRVDVVDTTTKAVTSLPAIPDPGCTNGVARPWALKVMDGQVYVGLVCSAENTGGTQADLMAHVYAYDGSAWNTTPVLSFGLDYTRACAYDYQGTQTGCQGWQPWIGEHNDITSNFIFGSLFFSHPTPILSDIEFDNDGAMILAFIDRTAMQYGTFNYQPDSSDTGLYQIVGGGELLRAHLINGSYVLEDNGNSSDPTTAGLDNNSGPGGGEYYFEDQYHNFDDDDQHNESTVGGLAMRLGSDEVVATVFDPEADEADEGDGAANLDSGGINWYNNADGTRQQSLRLYDSSASFFRKGSGLGDLELICDEAPLEIGNYVWLDEDRDGVQDPHENGLEGIDVTLDCGGTVITTTTQSDDPDTAWNESGTYYFSGAAGGNAEGELVPDASCTVAVDTTQTELNGHTLTTANAEGDTSNDSFSDLRDSDGLANGDSAEVSFTMGSAGENNHGLDFGFIPVVDLELTKTVNTTSALRGDTVIYTLTVSNVSANDANSVEATDILPSELLYVSDDGAGTYDSDTGVWNIGIIGAGDSVVLNITVTVK